MELKVNIKEMQKADIPQVADVQNDLGLPILKIGL